MLLVATQAEAQWVRSAKSRAFSRSNAVATDPSGNVYTAGIFSCIAIFDADSLLNNSCGEVTPPFPPVARVDAFLSKRDQDGNLLWVRQFVGSTGNQLSINDIAVDPLGNCYITGAFTGDVDLIAAQFSNPDATTEFFLAKVLADGTVDWAVSDPVNADSETYAQRVSATADAVFITGAVRGDFQVGATIDSVGRDASFIAAYDGDGVSLWTHHFMEVNPNGSSRGKAIEAKGDSIWVFSSFTDSVRIDGSVVRPPGPVPTITAGVICLYDAAGILQNRVLTNTPFIEGIRLHRADASVYITGRAENITAINGDTLFNTTGIRAYVSSHSLDLATLQWVTPVTATSTTALTTTGLAVNAAGNIYASGSFQGASVTAPVTSATGGGGQNGFLLKLDPSGADLWLQSYGGGGDDALLGVATHDDDHTFVAGYFAQYVRVVGEELYTSSGNGFIARIDICPQLVADMLTADTTYVCKRESALFQVTNNTAYTYQWYLDGSPIAGAQTADYNAMAEGTYTARISQGGCSKLTPFAKLLLHPLPDSAVVTQDALENCEGSTATLTGPVGPYTYQWLDNGVAIPETNKDIVIATDGDYSLRVTDNLGCSILSDTFAIRFLAYPSAALTPPGGRYTLCSGNTLLLQADQSQAGMTWQWLKDDVPLAGEVSGDIAAATSGIYHASVKNRIGCETITEADTVIVQASPLVDLNDESLPEEICDGNTIRLVTPLVVGQSYQWRRDGVDIAGATTNTLDIMTPGTYVVHVENALCAQTSPAFDLVVNPLPTAVIDNATATAICEGDPYALNAVENPGDMYQWLRNNQVIAGEDQVTLTIEQSGNYSVQVTNAFNCQQTSPPTSIIVNLKPPAAVTAQGPTTFCEGESVALLANAGSGLSYQWVRNGNALPGETQPLLETADAGMIAVEVTNSNQCTRLSDAIDIQVVPVPTAGITSVTGSYVICERDSLELLGGTDPTYAFTWYYNDEPVDESPSSSYYAHRAGRYHVVAAVGSCRDTSASVTLEVKPNPLPIITRNEAFLSIAQFGAIQWYRDGQPMPDENLQSIHVDMEGTYSVNVINTEGCSAWSSLVPICLPLPAIQKVNDVLTVSIDAEAYQWQYQGLPIPGASLQKLTAQQSGSYSVEVTRDGCTMETQPVTVCIPYPFITQDPFTGVLKASPNPATAYQWYFEGKLLPGATTQAHIPDDAGTYAVRVDDLEGCASLSESFIVAPVTALELSMFQAVQLYPNPAKDRLMIENAAHQAMSVHILDAAGRTVRKSKLGPGTGELDITQLAPGVYTVVIRTGRQSGTWMFVKQ